jgi:outer membrane protein OmpA-like peptidoglycan-associated protein
MTVNASGTKPLSTARPLGRLPQTDTSAKPASTTKAGTDTLTISKAATAQLSDTAGKEQTFEGKALFGTGKDNVDKNSAKGLDDTLDKFAEAFKKLSPEQQKAMLEDPGFKIVVEGHASNSGNAHKYDNNGLSGRRANNTAKYVAEYLKGKGIDVPQSKIQAEAKGTPGAPKKIDNNDQEDRSANVKIVMPPPKEPEAPKAAPQPEKPAQPAPPPPPAPPAPPPQVGGPVSPVILPAGAGEDEEDKARKKQEDKPAAPPQIPLGTWAAPKTDGSYTPPRDPYQSGNVGPGYVRPANWRND